MYHQIIANHPIPKYFFLTTISGHPTSHPFIERVIETTRRECLDKILFFNFSDLQRKLNQFKEHYNKSRGHSSLNKEPPNTIYQG